MPIQEKKIRPAQPLTREESELLKRIDEQRESLIKLVQDLVRIDSVNIAADVYNERNGVFEFLEDYLKKAGFKTNPVKVPFPGGAKNQFYINLIAWLDGKAPGKSLQLNGHLDTVSYNPEKWDADTPPLGAVIKDGHIYGRGSGDMKSGVAAMVFAMRALKESGLDFNGKLQLWCTPDEETHGAYGSGYMVKHHPEIVKTDATILSEARSQPPLQSPVITVAEKGPHWLRFTFNGVSGHGSRPKPNSNALNKAVRFMSLAEEYFIIPQPRMRLNPLSYIRSYLKRYRPLDLLRLMLKKEKPANPLERDRFTLEDVFRTTYSFDMIEAGRKVNIVPDVCDLDVDFRVIPALSTQRLMDAISDFCTRLEYKVELPEGYSNKQDRMRRFRDAPVDVRVSVITIGQGYMVDDKSQFGKALKRSFEAVYETAPVVTISAGFSDSGHMINGGMEDVFNVGPHGFNHHNANEHVDIESIVSAAKLYLLTAYRYLNS